MTLILTNRQIYGNPTPDITLQGVEVITVDVRRGVISVEHRHKEFGPQHGEFEMASWPGGLPSLQFIP